MNKPDINDRLADSAREFESFAKALTCIAEEVPDRVSLSQVIFFLQAAADDLRGKRPTYTEVRDTLGEKVNRTLHATYRVLCERSRVYPKALGWLARQTNPRDNRENFLQLTPKGRDILRAVREHLGETR